MVKISDNARAELQDWIENEVPVEYYVNRTLSTPRGLSGERRGIGILKRPHENVIKLHDVTGEELIVMVNQKGIIEYCPLSADNFKITVRSSTDDTYVNLKLTN